MLITLRHARACQWTAILSAVLALVAASMTGCGTHSESAPAENAPTPPVAAQLERPMVSGSAIPEATQPLEGPVRTYTLLLQKDAVTVMDDAGKTRWTMAGLLEPSDVQFLPGRRVLLGEINRVTERTLDGKITWQVPIAHAKEFKGKWGDVGDKKKKTASTDEPAIVNKQIVVQRLNDGHTFIGCADRLIEVDATGKLVMDLPWNSVNAPRRTTARKLPDRTIVAFLIGKPENATKRSVMSDYNVIGRPSRGLRLCRANGNGGERG